MQDGQPFITDEGNVILDCDYGQIASPHELDLELRMIPGVVETGLFLDVASLVIVASPEGIRLIERQERCTSGS